MSVVTLCYAWYIIWACIGLLFWAETASFYILMTVLAFDTITGITKSVRLKRFKTSDAIWWVISKIFMVMLVMLFSIISQNKFPANERPEHISSWIMWFLIIAELISSIQNIIMVKTGIEIPEWDAVSFVYNGIIDKLRKVLQSIK